MLYRIKQNNLNSAWYLIVIEFFEGGVGNCCWKEEISVPPPVWQVSTVKWLLQCPKAIFSLCTLSTQGEIHFSF